MPSKNIVFCIDADALTMTDKYAQVNVQDKTELATHDSGVDDAVCHPVPLWLLFKNPRHDTPLIYHTI